MERNGRRHASAHGLDQDLRATVSASEPVPPSVGVDLKRGADLLPPDVGRPHQIVLGTGAAQPDWRESGDA